MENSISYKWVLIWTSKNVAPQISCSTFKTFGEAEAAIHAIENKDFIMLGYVHEYDTEYGHLTNGKLVYEAA